jgi:hypothetical protein
MKKLSKFLLISTIVFFIGVSPVLSATILTEDFEPYSTGVLNGQGSWTGSTDFLVEDTVFNKGLQAVKIEVNPSDISKTGTETADGRLTASMRRSGHGTGSLTLYLLDDTDNQLWAISLQASNLVKIFGNTGWNTVGAYTDNLWAIVEIEWRSSDHKARARVDGGTWTDYFPENSELTTNPSKISLFSNTDNTGYFDAIQENPDALPVATEDITLSDLYEKIIASPDTGAFFYLNKTITYGDIILFVFLVIFLVWGVIVGLWKFVFPFSFRR